MHQGNARGAKIETPEVFGTQDLAHMSGSILTPILLSHSHVLEKMQSGHSRLGQVDHQPHLPLLSCLPLDPGAS